jgi:CubicO group peptidase (beta-lactamase class C family)
MPHAPWRVARVERRRRRKMYAWLAGVRISGVWQGVGMESLKVSLGRAMLDPSTPCERATPETALRPFQVWHAHGAGGLRGLSSTLLDTPRCALMVLSPWRLLHFGCRTNVTAFRIGSHRRMVRGGYGLF